jgi:streptogramin lyase
MFTVNKGPGTSTVDEGPGTFAVDEGTGTFAVDEGTETFAVDEGTGMFAVDEDPIGSRLAGTATADVKGFIGARRPKSGVETPSLPSGSDDGVPEVFSMAAANSLSWARSFLMLLMESSSSSSSG